MTPRRYKIYTVTGSYHGERDTVDDAIEATTELDAGATIRIGPLESHVVLFTTTERAGRLAILNVSGLLVGFVRSKKEK